MNPPENPQPNLVVAEKFWRIILNPFAKEHGLDKTVDFSKIRPRRITPRAFLPRSLPAHSPPGSLPSFVGLISPRRHAIKIRFMPEPVRGHVLPPPVAVRRNIKSDAAKLITPLLVWQWKRVRNTGNALLPHLRVWVRFRTPERNA